MLRGWNGPVSIGGARYSMGGQIAAADSLHLDMRAMKGVVAFDAAARTIRVQAGTTWRDVQEVVDPRDLAEAAVVYRNREASLDVASLEPRTRRISTYLLQEYFVPVERFAAFAQRLARILQAFPTGVPNVSIRHSPADATSLMPWAREEVFSFVLFYKMRANAEACARAAVWTRELIDAALAQGGRYYLPYRLDATQTQFDRAYPEARAARALKRRVDPRNVFRNLLWSKYLVPG